MNRKSAIYLIGHGPYREPRLVELQYLRILRYRNALGAKLDCSFERGEVFIDLNYPRDDYSDDFSELDRLTDALTKGDFDVVFVDIEIGGPFHPNRLQPIINRLEHTGASVVRQTVDNLLSLARARFTFSRMSDALAVQMKGFGATL